tara:strand:+ start:682 stop:894 length:213 start_codon:yes stop_codon:yes gene_type:complete
MSRIRRNKNMRQEDRFKSPRRRARVQDMDYNDLYFDGYEPPYRDSLRGRRKTRRMNGRPMGTCGSCGKRR